MRISDWSSDVCSSDLGHHEYVTSREFGLVMVFRNLGGNLMFLSAHNFFWRVERDGSILRLIAMWRDLGSEERSVGKEWSVRVDLGGRRIIKKTKTQTLVTYGVYSI